MVNIVFAILFILLLQPYCMYLPSICYDDGPSISGLAIYTPD